MKIKAGDRFLWESKDETNGICLVKEVKYDSHNNDEKTMIKFDVSGLNFPIHGKMNLALFKIKCKTKID